MREQEKKLVRIKIKKLKIYSVTRKFYFYVFCLTAGCLLYSWVMRKI